MQLPRRTSNSRHQRCFPCHAINSRQTPRNGTRKKLPGSRIQTYIFVFLDGEQYRRDGRTAALDVLRHRCYSNFQRGVPLARRDCNRQLTGNTGRGRGKPTRAASQGWAHELVYVGSQKRSLCDPSTPDHAGGTSSSPNRPFAIPSAPLNLSAGTSIVDPIGLAPRTFASIKPRSLLSKAFSELGHATAGSCCAQPQAARCAARLLAQAPTCAIGCRETASRWASPRSGEHVSSLHNAPTWSTSTSIPTPCVTA